jgi:hypothetical protein
MSEKSQEKQTKKKKAAPRERDMPQGVQDLGLKKISKPRHREQAHWDNQALGFARFFTARVFLKFNFFYFY